MRKFRLIARAGGNGSSLVDLETGTAIDGIERVEVHVQANTATRVVLTLLGEVEAEIEADEVEQKKSPPG